MSAVARKGFAVMRSAHQRVLLSAWQARRHQGPLWSAGLFGLLLLWQGNLVAAAVLSYVAVAGVWVQMVGNVLQQNHPHTARLLPAHVSVLRNALWVICALLCAVATLLSWLVGGPVLVTVAGMAVGLALLALCQRWAVLWPVYVTLCFLPSLSMGRYLEPVLSVWHAAPEALTLLALVLAAMALRAVVMTGDARHERAHASLKVMSAALRGQVSGTPAQPLGAAGWTWFLKLRNNGYSKRMDRVLIQAEAEIGARLALGLGPQAHWTRVMVGQAMWLTLSVLLLIALRLFPDWVVGHAMVWGLMAGNVMSCLAVTLWQLPAALLASRREQALLRLLPGVPSGALLNRWLAMRLSGVHMAVLTLQVLQVAVMSEFAKGDNFGGQVAELAQAALLLGLPLSFALWRDWAGVKTPAGGAQALTVVAGFAVFGMAAAWVYWIGRPWFELATLTLLLMVPLGWWRWRVISRAPSAWPVGRLG